MRTTFSPAQPGFHVVLLMQCQQCSETVGFSFATNELITWGAVQEHSGHYFPHLFYMVCLLLAAPLLCVGDSQSSLGA